MIFWWSLNPKFQLENGWIDSRRNRKKDDGEEEDDDDGGLDRPQKTSFFST